jgi:glucose/mannose-6-phosphate isomerase
MNILDDLDYIRKVDQSNMLKEITDFPASARKAIENTERIRIKILSEDYDSILITGMGGSAVGGLLLKDWLLDSLKIPITVSRSYHLPAWVNENTLVYAVSYSGDTEETLNQYDEAVEKGCTVICFCSGGRLEEKAKQNNQVLIKFPKGHQPRAAIPFQFYNLVGVTRRIGLINDSKWYEVEESIKIAEKICEKMHKEVIFSENECKRLADEIKGFIPFIYAPTLLQNVAYRYSTQFNENSKSPAATNFYPEAFHNSIMSREGSEDLLKRICIVVIDDPKEDSKLNRKIEESVNLMSKAYGKTLVVNAEGESNLARVISALIKGDYISAYLGLLYGVDPSTTESIRILKSSVT